MGKKDKGSLGRLLLRDKLAITRGKRISSDGSLLHTAEVDDGYDWARLNLQSITEESSFAEFIATAELAGTEFEAERRNITLITPDKKPGILSLEEKQKIRQLHDNHKNNLRIPRRPSWSPHMTADELAALERESFLTWRRKLAQLQEVEGIIMTPYERNLEFWRQLWRVIEKSDVIVQIVDSRNPLMFRCEDLEDYIREVDKTKKCIILLNKADFLTYSQRRSWAQYFDSIGMKVLFYTSVMEAKSDNEMDEKHSHVSSCNSTKVLTRLELLSAFKLLCPNKEGEVTIGLVGYPNVGKSSAINSLMMDKKVSVSKTPGKTKHFQTLYATVDIILCDCPGLVMPSFVNSKAEMILWGILPIDQMTDHVPSVNIVASLFPRDTFEDMYGIILPPIVEDEDPLMLLTSQELLNAYGYMRGFMTNHGLPDNSRSARYILKDFVSGRLLYCHAPPGYPQDEYHHFKDRISKQKIQPAPLARFNKPNKTTVEDLDNAFFNKASIQPHFKGVNGATVFIAGEGGSSTSSDGKPWKKHKNFKKKEKLRRVYRHLDE